MKDTYSRSRCIQYLIGVSHISWNVSLLSVIITLYNPPSAIILIPVETPRTGMESGDVPMHGSTCMLCKWDTSYTCLDHVLLRCLGVWSGFTIIWWGIAYSGCGEICSWEGRKTRYSRLVLWKYCNFRSIYFCINMKKMSIFFSLFFLYSRNIPPIHPLAKTSSPESVCTTTCMVVCFVPSVVVVVVVALVFSVLLCHIRAYFPSLDQIHRKIWIVFQTLVSAAKFPY